MDVTSGHVTHMQTAHSRASPFLSPDSVSEVDNNPFNTHNFAQDESVDSLYPFHIDVSPGRPSRHYNNDTMPLQMTLIRSNEGQMIRTAEAVVDTNGDRRKRQKLTPQPENQAKVDDYAKGYTDASTEASTLIQQQIGDDRTNINAAVSADDGFLQHQDSTPHKTCPSSIQSEQDTFDPTPHQDQVVTQPALHSVDFADKASSIDNEGELKRKKATPRKKTISLNSNGTLLSSPHRLKSDLHRQDVPSSKKSSILAKNVKIKNGKFIRSLPIILRYGRDTGRREDIGSKIDNILRVGELTPNETSKPNATTHPFFLGKMKSKSNPILVDMTDHEDSSRETDVEVEVRTKAREPVAWKDIKFSRAKTSIFKSVDASRPIWPPYHLADVGRRYTELHTTDDDLHRAKRAKRKSRLLTVDAQENVFARYICHLQEVMGQVESIAAPSKRILSGREADEIIQPNVHSREMHPAVAYMRGMLINGTSPFDKGETAGQHAWTSKYAPRRSSEVLQTSANVLHDWLQTLAVHQVKSGKDQAVVKLTEVRRKKRSKKVQEELDDFIVHSDEDEVDTAGVKNAFVISGPSGCGKTASVFAVAKELGFEVFEIHPGMRRNTKDIFDKVGDMTQNHLVQKQDTRSRSSSAVPQDVDLTAEILPDTKQSSMASFIKDDPSSAEQKPKVNKGMKKEQKQSLILLEEVDILFEDDRGFWTGVQTLIQQSKRPVVMTCNSTSSLPMDDLNVHAVLEYSAPPQGVVVDYLAYIAAAEGHLIDHSALATLYSSTQNDLRASITGLDLWCQMTVGSKFGGLDWFMQSSNGQQTNNAQKEKLRTFSEHTYTRGLDLLPSMPTNEQEGLLFASTMLEQDISSWVETVTTELLLSSSEKSYQDMSTISQLTDAASALDLLDIDAAAPLAAMLSICGATQMPICNRDTIATRYINSLSRQSNRIADYIDALEPLMEEKPVFPPSVGRLAPSIDNAGSIVVTDIAPYVRTIVAFDLQLEQQREEAFGSQGKKSRTTRAARAAAEGGDKASTRTERWFPKQLDFQQVMATGGSSWPLWHNDTNVGDGGGVDEGTGPASQPLPSVERKDEMNV